MKVTFTNNATLSAKAVHIYEENISVTPLSGIPQLYELFGIKSIIPEQAQKPKAPTELQNDFTRLLQKQGYVWDKKHSTAAAGVVLKKPSGDFWFFGMEGEIMHNPEALASIKL